MLFFGVFQSAELGNLCQEGVLLLQGLVLAGGVA